MKNVKKISIILMILMIVNLLVSSVVFAENDKSFSDVITEADNWLTSNTADIDTSSIAKTIKPIAQALTTVGVGVILCVTAVMGIKWVTAKPDEQAKLKQQSIGLLVSAIVILGAYTIWSIAYKIVNGL